MPLSDRLEARRRETEESTSEPIPQGQDYEQLATELADRVSRLGSYRGHSDRARILHQLTEIDHRVHALLAQLGGTPTA
jgi:hypothetical protein